MYTKKEVAPVVNGEDDETERGEMLIERVELRVALSKVKRCVHLALRSSVRKDNRRPRRGVAPPLRRSRLEELSVHSEAVVRREGDEGGGDEGRAVKA